MQRYFVEETRWENDILRISGDDSHHIVRVMRMKAGDELIAIHPEKGPAHCKIAEISEGSVSCKVMNWVEEEREMPVHVTIVASLGKGDKLEQIVQKGTELGASSFIPYQADRSVAKWDAKKEPKKIQRLQKIAKEACEQSERTFVPDVKSVHTLDQILKLRENYDYCFFGYADEARHSNAGTLKHALKPVKDEQSILVAFGPEGGFSELEVERFKQSDFSSITLGPRILRMETAPLYFLSTLSFMME
ncbi:16S rRNA (uracil1498-N3)-methyltransferase [Halobacillus karajensis]|uniref:Ribosomal RNA small subunit methyltransferase E n=1 Tax=Halobacillus karajensis TaxID=195088 RepID=A0A024P7R1_9BACI|nr:16S rRNA (uracil(1498)-N(3))-methyltransferase [Halobacillus karajensis]CDQ18047.1 Ribosomal RNA small subunit methyltransferase E [Halobacillus karajensis]CDQ24397.1 Ribosomal RNA small subunit methyltransferase E [Halobacillus karajensis]CDQ29355.1 Ribosomal RNA small subunit methyltransferase E [Halobacillus karajensis]SEH60324.1 16S rRNA (uracil1498-N3)-methyltransferase [Halobacillus karajensis]